MFEYRTVDSKTGYITLQKTPSRSDYGRKNEALVSQARELGITDTQFTYAGLAVKVSDTIRGWNKKVELKLPYYLVMRDGSIVRKEGDKKEYTFMLENGAVKTRQEAKRLAVSRQMITFRTVDNLGNLVEKKGTMDERYQELERLMSIAGRLGLNVDPADRHLAEYVSAVVKQSSASFGVRRNREGHVVYESMDTPNDPIGIWRTVIQTPALFFSQYGKRDASVMIQLVGVFEDGGGTTLSFRSRSLSQFHTFEEEIINALLMPRNGSDARMTITIIRVVFIPELVGGCNSGCHKRSSLFKLADGTKLSNPSSKHNNCFFKCFTDKETGKKLTDNVCNEIRKKYGLKPDSMVSARLAVKIALEEWGLRIVIMNSDSLKIEGSHGDQCLFLVDSHYMRLDTKLKTCGKCGETYYNKHGSCQSRRLFNESKKTGIRYVIPKSRMDEKENIASYILHYDIETTPKNEKDEHTPYAVGYAWHHANGDSQYETITGEGCMTKFYARLQCDDLKHIKFINAFNGANFDHFSLVGAMLQELKGKPNIGLHNSSITGGEVAGKKLVDVAKHLSGSLKANLQDMKCSISKGEINHNLTDTWEKMSEEMRSAVSEYLKADVCGLMELTEKYNAGLYEKYQINFTSYVSLSSMTYPIWNSKFLKDDVALPSMEQEEDFRKAVYGGRCYKNRHNFMSSQYDDFIAGKVDEKDITDHIIDLDVVSLYPTAMGKYEYPIGECLKTSHYISGKLGIYHVKYVAPTSLQTPILPRREKGSLKWDNLPGEGYYTSIDIENAQQYGYKIEILDGWYWEKTAPIFESYVEEMFRTKQNSEKGTVSYAMSKLMMNALYGKMIQKPIHKKLGWIEKLEDFWAILHKNDILEIHRVGDRLAVNYEPTEIQTREANITKPTQLGAFILSYSRRIMNGWGDRLDCWQNPEKLFHYTDTDSIQVHASCASHIKMGKELGDLSDDVGGKVLRACWIQPKLYFLDYLKKNEKVKKTDQVIHRGDEWSIVRHNRAKGVHSSMMTEEVFTSLSNGDSVKLEAKREDTNNKFFQMRRIHIKQNSSQKEAGINPFSIIHVYPSKVIQRTAWAGRNFTGANISVPWGYCR